MFKSALINIMTNACHEAAHQLIRDFNEVAFLKANRSVQEFVNNTRQRVIDIIQEHLIKSNPGHGIITDNKITRPSKTGLIWAINPIDCPENFMHRLPFFGSCIALLAQPTEEKDMKNYANSDILAATFFDPIRDEMFWAEKNNNAFLNARKLMLTHINKSQRMKLHGNAQQEDEISLITGRSKNANRNFGSSVMHMAYLAAGRINETHEKFDDIANICTGKLLVQEAKGTISTKQDTIIATR